jgi:hypothetical protein
MNEDNTSINKGNKAVNPCHFWIERGIISRVSSLVMRASIANSLKEHCWPLIKKNDRLYCGRLPE